MDLEMPNAQTLQQSSEPVPTSLDLTGVSKAFDGKVVADRIDLSVRRGEFFTLLGPSGSGK